MGAAARRAARTACPTRRASRLLYSQEGLYVLMEATDGKLTATMKEDFREPVDRGRVRGLPLARRARPDLLRVRDLAAGLRAADPGPQPRRQVSWLAAWHYEGDRRTAKRPPRCGGAKKSGAKVTGWTAEFFIPYELLEPLHNVPPKSGTRWRANFYRMDYDDGQDNAAGTGPRRPELSRVPEVRHGPLEVASGTHRHRHVLQLPQSGVRRVQRSPPTPRRPGPGSSLGLTFDPSRLAGLRCWAC